MNLIGKAKTMCKVAKTVDTILKNGAYDGMRLSVECNGTYISARKDNPTSSWEVTVRKCYDLDTTLGSFNGIEAERFVAAALETMADDDLAYCQYRLDGHLYDYRPALKKWVELY